MKTPAIREDIYRPQSFADGDINPTARHALSAMAPYKQDCIKNFRRRTGELRQVGPPRGGWPQFGPDGKVLGD